MRIYLICLFLLQGSLSAYSQNEFWQDKIVPTYRLSMEQLDSAFYHHYGQSAYQEALHFAMVAYQKALKKKGEDDLSTLQYANHLGDLYLKQGVLDSAQLYVDQTINVYQKQKLDQSTGTELYIFALITRSVILQRRGLADQAIQDMEKAKEITVRSFGRDHSYYIPIINNLAALHRQQFAFEAALFHLGEAKDWIDQQGKKDERIYVGLLEQLSAIQQELGQMGQAEQWMKEVLAIRKKWKEQDQGAWLHAQANWASFKIATGDYIEARRILQQVIQETEQLHGKNAPSLLTYYNNLATIYRNLGLYELAISSYDRSKEVMQKVYGINHSAYAILLNNKAKALEYMGRYDEALNLLVEAKMIFQRRGEFSADYALSMNNMADLHTSMGNFEMAIPLYLQTLDIRKEVLGKKHPSYANTLNNLATLYYKMNQFANAYTYADQAVEITKASLGQQHPSYAAMLSNLAAIYKKEGRFSLALQLSEQAIQIYALSLGKQHQSYAVALKGKADLLKRLKKDDEAIACLRQVRTIQAAAIGTRHPSYLATLNGIAAFFAEKEEKQKAIDYVREAIESNLGFSYPNQITVEWMEKVILICAKDGSRVEPLIQSLQLLFQVSRKDTETKEQWSYIAELATKILRNSLLDLSSDTDKLRILSLTNLWVLNSLQVLDPSKDAAIAFDLATSNKSVLLTQSIHEESIKKASELPDSMMIEWQELVYKKERIMAQLQEKRSNESFRQLRNELNVLYNQTAYLRREIEKKDPNFKYDRQEQNMVDHQQVQTALSDRTAYVEYVVGEDWLHLFYIDKQKVVWKRVPMKRAELMAQIRGLRKQLYNYQRLSREKIKAYTDYVRSGRWFYDYLIEPLELDFNQIDRLIIVPDAELGHIPFEVFLEDKPIDQRVAYQDLPYLMNQVEISYSYSSSFWKENMRVERGANNGELLAMAASYDRIMESDIVPSRLPTERMLRDELQSLPAAEQEVSILETRFQGYFGFGETATERLVKEKADQYAIIHLAMHGIVNNQQPELSSLAFTEDGDSMENNFWQAHEIAQSKLKADLVVLSACETGFGKYERGNGIASLARAFMFAGANSILVSLWQINDYATAKIMVDFYENMSAGMEKDRALREAKQTYIQEAKGHFAHPAYWSSFIQIGDSRAIEIKKRTNKSWMYMYLFIPLILALTLYRALKK